jgi:glyoxylase-like metal-dependent hydrolase (beta-lactamase superfamily II)
MDTFAPDTTCIDVEHLGNRHVIAACLIESGTHRAIIDPGPESSLKTVLAKLESRGLGVEDLTAVILTHIHLDHAAATGKLVQLNPRLKVYVHERGARHMIDPTRLLDSAGRLYGDDMQRLWGELLPVPRENVVALAGGESISVGRRSFEVAYTPGHASHHVSYFERETSLAWVGDTAGVRVLNAAYVKPPTPPPDINLELWDQSIAVIRDWKPERLFVTHFGLSDGVDDHLDQLADRLRLWCQWVQESLAGDANDVDRMKAFSHRVDGELRDLLGDGSAAFLQSAPSDMCWQGLARYIRKRSP